MGRGNSSTINYFINITLKLLLILIKIMIIDTSIIISTILGIILSIIGYFLKRTMDDLDKTKDLSNKTKSELDVLKTDHLNKHEHLSDKFDDLKDSIVILTREIKELTAKMK